MRTYIILGLLVFAGFIGLWQCFKGWQTGRMFAFDPGGSAAQLERSDGWLFVSGWWFTFLLSLGVLGLSVGMALNEKNFENQCREDCEESR